MNFLSAFLVCTCMLIPVLGSAAERHALLIGISDYKSEKIERLEGPAHDLVAIKHALIRHWAFDPVKTTTLLNSQATYSNIRKALSDLHDAVNSGDHVFFYFSGHGTSAHDPQRLWPMPFGTGALVPHDAEISPEGTLDKVIFSRSDIRPIFESMDRGAITVLAILDTCYSEHATRRIRDGSYRVVGGSEVKQELIRPGSHLTARTALLAESGRIEPYPYINVYMIAAAGENELALDLDYKVMERYPTLDGMPHGALTDSVLRVMNGKLAADINNDGLIVHQELFETTRSFVTARGLEQSPKAYPSAKSDTNSVSRTPLFITGKRQ